MATGVGLAQISVKFADPDYPLLGPRIGVVSSIQAELLPILCLNKRWLVAMATRVSQG